MSWELAGSSSCYQITAFWVSVLMWSTPQPSTGQGRHWPRGRELPHVSHPWLPPPKWSTRYPSLCIELHSIVCLGRVTRVLAKHKQHGGDSLTTNVPAAQLYTQMHVKQMPAAAYPDACTAEHSTQHCWDTQSSSPTLHTQGNYITQTHTMQNRCWEHWPPCATGQWLLWDTSLALVFIAPTPLVIQTLICVSQLLLLLRFVLMQKLPHFLLYRGLGFLSFGGFFFLNPTSTCWVSKVQTHSTFTLPQRTWSSNEYVHSNNRHEVSSSKGKRKLFQNPAFLHHLCQQLSFIIFKVLFLQLDIWK